VHLIYLPANQAWAFVFGDDLSTAQVIKLENADSRFFAERGDAVAAAAAHRLDVDEDGAVMAAVDEESVTA
jgi:hypothetical protein